MAQDQRTRCFGGPEDPLMVRYHDEEWGRPVHDDRHTFELLALEGAQAGLSWQTILRKRENFRKAFDAFKPVKVAAYTDEDRERLMGDAGIVRTRAKIDAIINNAQRFLEVQTEFGSFDRYIWQFTDHKTLRRPGPLTLENMPAWTPESEAMSADLKNREAFGLSALASATPICSRPAWSTTTSPLASWRPRPDAQAQVRYDR